MGSTRLPGKVLLDIGGETTLGRVVHRLSRAKLITEVTIATTESPADDAIVSEAKRLGVRCFRGSEQDVLARYQGAAEAFAADVVVRVTSDCPLIDAQLADDVIRKFLDEGAAFACNVWPRTYPRGLDTEVFASAAMKDMVKLAGQPHQREHVTPWFYEHRDEIRFLSVHGDADHSSHRWTLDTPEDLQLIREIYQRFDNRMNFGWREILARIERSPELCEINAHIVQKSIRESA
jgi:spore coat polysaccharide biosynthesis protein SpsF